MICPKCNKEKYTDRWYCKKCENEYNRKRKLKNRKIIVMVSCVECGDLTIASSIGKRYCDKCYKERRYNSTLKYRKTEKGLESHRNTVKKYQKTETGLHKKRLWSIKTTNKRNRNLGWVSLFSNPFPKEVDVDYHHVNNVIVIPIPRRLHHLNLGPNHRERMNNVIENLYGMDFNKIIEDMIKGGK